MTKSFHKTVDQPVWHTLNQKWPMLFCFGILLVKKEGGWKGRGRESGRVTEHERKWLQKWVVKVKSSRMKTHQQRMRRKKSPPSFLVWYKQTVKEWQSPLLLHNLRIKKELQKAFLLKNTPVITPPHITIILLSLCNAQTERWWVKTLCECVGKVLMQPHSKGCSLTSALPQMVCLVWLYDCVCVCFCV